MMLAYLAFVTASVGALQLEAFLAELSPSSGAIAAWKSGIALNSYWSSSSEEQSQEFASGCKEVIPQHLPM